jgi:hypothetical protein
MEDGEEPALPASLRAVAYFTILCGIGTLLTMVTDLANRHLNINIGVLQIPAGFGILRLSRGWRTFQLWMLWFGMIGFGIALLILLFGGSFPTLTMYGRFATKWGRELAFVICAITVGVLIWQYRVLTAPPIRRLFGLPPRR